ncbi:MAG: TIGR00153 family protein [bacterium]
MQFFSKKENETRQAMCDHAAAVGETLKLFKKMMFAFFNRDDEYRDIAFSIHQAEHRADEIRRDVEIKIFEGAFMPVFREDYIMLAELTDAIADLTEYCSDFVTLQNPFIPEELTGEFKELVVETTVTFRPLEDLIKPENMDDSLRAHELVDKIESFEQAVDKLEWDLIKKIFKMDSLSLAQKIHLRGLINLIAGIADKVEDASDRILIIMAKNS